MNPLPESKGKPLKLVIIGGIGTAVNIAEQMKDAIDKWGLKDEFLGFAFDNPDFGPEINGYPLLCKSTEVWERYGKYDDVRFIYQLYRPDKLVERTQLLHSFNIPTERFYNFIHPLATVARSARLGFGNAVHANCVINSNAVLGHHNTLNSGALIGHDTTLGNNNFFAAQSMIGSNVKLGNCIFVGLNAAVNNQIELKDNIMVGMGSHVIKSLEGNQVVIGSPAKFVKNI